MGSYTSLIELAHYNEYTTCVFQINIALVWFSTKQESPRMTAGECQENEHPCARDIHVVVGVSNLFFLHIRGLHLFLVF